MANGDTGLARQGGAGEALASTGGGTTADAWMPIAVKRHETTVTLSDEDGTLTKIPGMKVKVMEGNIEREYPLIMPSAAGFAALAQAACLMLYKPPTIEVDGRRVPNGSADNRGRYHCCAMAMGHNVLGRPWVSNKTIIYDADLYNLVDLLAKAKYAENVRFFKVRPFQGRDAHGVLKGSPREGQWAAYPMDAMTVLWVDCDCPNFIRWAGEMTNRRKLADRTAQTFAERNAIMAHPAIPPRRKFVTPKVTLSVVAWVGCHAGADGKPMNAQMIGETEARAFQEQAGVTVEAEIVDLTDPKNLTDEELAVQHAEIAAAAADASEVAHATDEEGASTPAAPSAAPVSVEPSAEDKAQMKQLKDSIREASKGQKELYLSLCQEVGIVDKETAQKARLEDLVHVYNGLTRK